MSDDVTQTVILYRQGDQDYITFGNGQPIEVRIVESVPLEIQGAAKQVSSPDLGGATQYIVVPNGGDYVDSIHYAAQLGRLDVLTLLVAVFALGGFWLFRREAKAVARDVAEAETRSEVRRLLQDMVPLEVSKAVGLLVKDTAQEDEAGAADPYAAAQEDENGPRA